MSKYVVEFSHRANLQIRNIFSYISENNPNAALTMVETLEVRAYQLESNPFLGTELLKDEYPLLPFGYRKLIVKPFIIYYRVFNKTVCITHIVHSRRNQAEALAEDNF